MGGGGLRRQMGKIGPGESAPGPESVASFILKVADRTFRFIDGTAQGRQDPIRHFLQ